MTQDKDPTTITTDKPTSPESTRGPEEGRDELNLIELPFALITHENKQRLTSINRRWVEQGREFYLRVSPNPDFGLPTFRTEEVMIAALELSHRQGFKSREVHTTKQEMLELMRWHDNGHYRQSLVQAFSQLAGIVIRTNRFWNRTANRYEEAQAGFGVIDDFAFYEDESRRSRGQLALPLSYFRWNQVLWDSYTAGYIKRLNTALYFSLRTNLARRLYRYVDKWVYRGGQEIDLEKLATIKLGMSDQYRYPSLIVQKLKPAIEELNSRGVARIAIVRSKTTESGYKAVIQPVHAPQRAFKAKDEGEKPSEVQTPRKTLNLPPQRASEPENPLVKELVQRGISERPAKQLVRDYGEDQVRLQIEVFDFLTGKEDNRIKNPPAYLRGMIKEGWFTKTPPEGFESKAQRAEREQRRRQTIDRLLGEYHTAVAQLREEVADWANLAPEQRINPFFVDEWESSVRRRHHRNPSDEERQARIQKLIADLRTPEAEFKHRLAILRSQFIQKGHEHGQYDTIWLDAPSTPDEAG